MLFSEEQLRKMYAIRFREEGVTFVECLNGFKGGDTVTFQYRGISATSGTIRLLLLRGRPPSGALAVVGISGDQHILIPTSCVRTPNVTEDRADETGQ
ncbi:MAG: hypothetical protein HY567_03905 [Candidatus Kerfeldbacteria bacterium]|nr:hypothetical protein [Candidatus Kerfeldbacteria bacterium]